MLRIYYNPECSKSRSALSRLQAAGLEPEIVDYLRQPPLRRQLEDLIGKLDEPAARLLRQQPHNPELRDADVVDALLASPELLQRPIVERDAAAIIARPPETVDEFLGIGSTGS